MKAEINTNRKPIYLTYQELEPKDMNQFTPRTGYYKVIRKCKVLIPKYTLDGLWVHWKLNIEDEFDSGFETRIQLASFERNAYPGSAELLKSDLTNRTIHIKGAAKDSMGKFIVDWEILPETTLEKLNGELKNCIMDQVLSSDFLQDTDSDYYDDLYCKSKM
jgi:hypothetical protein